MRLVAATGLASIRTILEPFIGSLRRRALFAVIVGLMWLAAICFGLVWLTLSLSAWIGTAAATATVAATLAIAAMLLHWISVSVFPPAALIYAER